MLNLDCSQGELEEELSLRGRKRKNRQTPILALSQNCEVCLRTHGLLMPTTNEMKPRVDLRNLALAGFVIAAPFWLILVWTEGQTNVDPLWTYYRNAGIRWICIGALLTDVAILASAVGGFAATRSDKKALAQCFSFGLIFLALIGAALTWLELWYGSTFYYGEVRDKQGLPFTVNNGGPAGSFIFFTYVLWALPIRKLGGTPPLLLKGAGTLILLFAHWLVFNLLKEPWGLWQS
jgi:hypothetical protein